MSFDLPRWLAEDALPHWGKAGFDERAGLFVERLDLRGRPLLDVPRRVMVQARQIFVFSTAHRLGLYNGAYLALEAGETLIRRYAGDGHPGWAFSLSREGTIIDRRRDLYAQAFVLFALAHLFRLSGDVRWLKTADVTLHFLDAAMAASPPGTYLEVLPLEPGGRRQNPHMHLFEALLALHEACGNRGYLVRASVLACVLRSHFLHGPLPTLVEYYDADLKLIEGRPLSFEPGHHFEWAWLLVRYARLAQDKTVQRLARQLWDSATKMGIARDGGLSAEVGEDGTVIDRSGRLWAYAEAGRAATIRWDATYPRHLGFNAAMASDEVQKRFLISAPRGCWIDSATQGAGNRSTYIAASDLYHLVGFASAFMET